MTLCGTSENNLSFHMYTYSDLFLFTDKDECTTGTHNCIEGALCLNVIGSFRCVCPGENGQLIDCTGTQM